MLAISLSTHTHIHLTCTTPNAPSNDTLDSVRTECAKIALDALRVYHKLLAKVDRVPEIARRAACHIFHILGVPITPNRSNPYATSPGVSAATTAASLLFNPNQPLASTPQLPLPSVPTIFSFAQPTIDAPVEKCGSDVPVAGRLAGPQRPDAASFAPQPNSTNLPKNPDAEPQARLDPTAIKTMRPPTYNDSEEYMDRYYNQLPQTDVAERTRVATMLDQKFGEASAPNALTPQSSSLTPSPTPANLTKMRPPTYNDSEEYLQLYLDHLEQQDSKDWSERFRVANMLDRKFVQATGYTNPRCPDPEPFRLTKLPK